MSASAIGMQHLLQAMSSTAWAIQPEKLAAVLEVIALRASGQRFTEEERAARLEAANAAASAASARPASTAPAGQIAVLPLFGVLGHRMNMVQDISAPGGTSTELYQKWFESALADEAVKAIVLDIDSPGGTVAGCEELAAVIHGARGEKPIVAIANALCASAAYWIGSAADELVMTPSGQCGSIGVFTVHVDQSGLDAMRGMQWTVIAAGKYKVEGHSHAPLDDEAAAQLQAHVNEYYEAFTKAVARNRGIAASKVRGGFGEGRVVGAKQALELGMIDRIATLDQVLVKLGARGRRSGAKATAALKTAAALEAPAPAAVELGGTFTDLELGVAHLITDLAGALGEAPARIATVQAGTTGASAEDPARPSFVEVLTEPAPAAKEHAMDKDTAAAAAGTAAPPAPQPAAQSPHKALVALAKEHGFAERSVELLDCTTFAEGSTKILSWIAERSAGAAPATRTASPTGRVGTPREAEKPFASFGDQILAIRRASMPGAGIDPRLLHINSINAATGLNEGVGSEGGFAVQSEFLPDIIEPMYQTGEIMSRVQRVPVGEGKNGVTSLEVDETSRAKGSRFGGVSMAWLGEGQTTDPSKPKYLPFKLELKKLAGFWYTTSELSEDSPATNALATRAFRTETQFMTEDSVFSGLGAGQPLGFLKSPALISVAIEGGQTIANTATHIAANVANMMGRMPAGLLGEAIWTYNPQIFAKLLLAKVGDQPVFLPAGGISGRPFSTIFGRPAFPTEYNEAEGTVGDLCFTALGMYRSIDKGGIKQASSLHVRFLNDEECFRVIYRVDGAPIPKQAVTPAKGSATISPFIALAARS